MALERTKDISEQYEAAVQPHARGMVAATAEARFADYSASDIDALSVELRASSFGCGDPVAFSGIRPGQTVLDLGCGAGLDVILAAEKVGPMGTVTGVDITDAMLDKARQNVAAAGLANVAIRKGTIEALPVDSGTVDWVISNCVINLSSDKPQVFAEIARVLRPGGHMLVSDIVAENLPFWARRSGLLTAACAGGAISEADYLDGLSKAGMEHGEVLARQHYEPSQMAAVALQGLPGRLAAIRCCGHPVAEPLLEKLARPVATRLWSARIHARKRSPS